VQIRYFDTELRTEKETYTLSFADISQLNPYARYDRFRRFLETVRSGLIKFSIVRIFRANVESVTWHIFPDHLGVLSGVLTDAAIRVKLLSHFRLKFSAVIWYMGETTVPADTMMKILRWSTVGAWRKASDENYNLYWYVRPPRKESQAEHRALRSEMKN